MTDGIYTLANDVVFDQVVALLNSIEANAGREMPVCIIAYDNRLDKVREEVAKRKNVTLLENPSLFQRWEDFSYQVWQTHPTALNTWKEQGITTKFYRVGENHRYGAFDPESPFEKFIYMDADTLLINSVDFIFNKLDEVDFVVYDFQYKDLGHIYNVASQKLREVFAESQIKSEIFCSGFYGSKRGLFTDEERQGLIAKLAQGESEILYPSAPNQSVLNYMRMRSQIPIYNFALGLPENQKTGNSVTSKHFENRDNVLYDKGTRLTYLHYIGVSSKLFTRVCGGENLDFPYRDIFLHYRYLHQPEKRPKFTTKPKPYNPPPSLITRVLRKLKINQ
ncbi:MAG TPA: sugar transferase [Cyanobacteria bacterium UBA11149]|nr:sugar transferase [Cyanobacteria bacterium UBA11367]HBE58576.1 sugar transferase [Cyanobacteria bacterium UBA11366]HBK65238.1 sugar transferase [Cyanobacteria bacterium UBA11166]HBR74035.1 sugar transferase [Cyanobacteria bacterium UBA11159]HBS67859.1 sugar transferase [Cyanobacteria bacterium UBA11153]HBW90651.1 sugar transferase [Cyanobacteria bacterium UBA11149]HCA93710.1 sugar transferase [Cyanobacteria bacterium UBA9226]